MENLDTEKQRVFYCYSFSLKNFMKKHGKRYINTSINSRTGRRYFIFLGDKEFNDLLEEYRKRRKEFVREWQLTY